MVRRERLDGRKGGRWKVGRGGECTAGVGMESGARDSDNGCVWQVRLKQLRWGMNGMREAVANEWREVEACHMIDRLECFFGIFCNHGSLFFFFLLCTALPRQLVLLRYNRRVCFPILLILRAPNGAI